MKVSEYLKGYTDPRGDGYQAVPPEAAQRVVDEIRELLTKDLWEEELCVLIHTRNTELSAQPDLLIAAFNLLHAWERRAWHQYVTLAFKC